MTIAMAQDKHLNINGLRLHYLDWGNDGYKPMLLLHGFMAHAHVWDEFASKFRCYYHVIALDQRGHGESQWSEEGAYTIEDHFVDLDNFTETLGLRNLILIGHSMGGRNALFYAAYNSHNIDRLILVDARAGNNPGSSKALRLLINKLPLQGNSIYEVAQQIRAIYPYLSWRMCYKIASYGYKQVHKGKLVPKYDVRMCLPLEHSGYSIQNLWHLMENVNCPTLVVRGKESQFLSRQEAQEMCNVLPQAEWREIPKSTHMPAQENSVAFDKAILDFISR